MQEREKILSGKNEKKQALAARTLFVSLDRADAIIEGGEACEPMVRRPGGWLALCDFVLCASFVRLMHPGRFYRGVPDDSAEQRVGNSLLRGQPNQPPIPQAR